MKQELPPGPRTALRQGDRGLALFGFRIPLKRPFRKVTERRGVLVKGPAGWGEYSPFPGYSDGKEHLAWQAALSSAERPWPPPLRRRIEVHVTVPEVDPEEAAQMVVLSGCSSAKVKVGDAQEEERVEAVRHALGAGGRLYIDANGAWDLDRALEKVRHLARYDIALVEQPVATLEDMRKLRRMVDVPLAADESIRTPADARQVARTGAADVIVLKVQSMAGVNEALSAAEQSGLPAVVSSLIETSVGTAAGLALAAALPALPYTCGLATVSLLESDIVADPLFPAEGAVEVRSPEPDESLLARYRAELPPW